MIRNLGLLEEQGEFPRVRKMCSLLNKGRGFPERRKWRKERVSKGSSNR